ncbi:WD domain-containing protein [Eremomyces bilateralis CBS 781.70]|uniref:WD domain-containing protein n=1 Tax=Eremomyces bilateralis CBS 781.70 TaxID=1392243 RepID=A0A6G1G249_9PEZI|nr:WD domain-containing protein [Eremomyces bilateralis CBS 781.70]KAF1812134.1 WD domain-containing protein [Eremomyces bilateralis CBS 781.70]
MKISNHSAVPVYTISGSSTARPLPEWLARQRKRSLKKDPEYANRVELLQDFEFEEASQCVRISEDGEWVMSTGTYKPQIHTHYLPHLSLSYARHTDSLNQTFILLSSDYSKSLHLQTDRRIDFQTRQGLHYSTRVPRFGRDLKYCKNSCEALIPSVGVNEDGNGEVFRLNLEVGRFMKGYEVDVGGDDTTAFGGGSLQGSAGVGAVNTAAVAEDSHNLLAFGTSIGTVEFWDPRSRGRVGILTPPFDSAPLTGKAEITALEFHQSGLTLAAGSSSGLVHLYDLRSPVPLLKKDQGYGYPIQNLIFLNSSATSRSQITTPKVLSSDKRIIKIWDQDTGKPWTSVEPAVDLHHVAWCPDSGMFLTANEGRQQHAFFIPQLGPAPKWCSFLDNIVEEMAEDADDPNSFMGQQAGSVYDNFKFLTLPQLRELNLDHLIGTTRLLRPYMHGYFVAQRLYEEARLISNPDLWQEQRAKTVQAKISKERESRIRGKKKVSVKVNRKLVERMLEKEAKNERKRAQRVLELGGDEDLLEEQAAAAQPGEDAVDGVAEAGGETKSATTNILGDSRFTGLFQDEDFEIDETSREFLLHNASTKVEAPTPLPRGLTAVEEEEMQDIRGSSESDESSSEEEKTSITKRSKPKPARQAPPAMHVSSSTAASKPVHRTEKSFGSRVVSLKERTRDEGAQNVTVVGEKEVSFVPRGKKKGAAAPTGDTGRVRSRFDKAARRSASGNTMRNL